MKYYNSWEIHTNGIRSLIQESVGKGEIEPADEVFRGPSGDAVVTDSIADLEAASNYSEAGVVEEYLD